MEDDIRALGRAALNDASKQGALLRAKHRAGQLALEYVLCPEDSYAPTKAQGIEALRVACARESYSPHPTIVVAGEEVYRSLSFAETIKARVEDFNRLRNADGSVRSMEDRLRLWDNTWLDSGTGIAYKGGTNEFKVVPVCEQIIRLPSGFNRAHLTKAEFDYETLPGEKFNSKSPKYKCDDWLTKDKVLVHPVWRFAAQADTDTFRGYFEEYTDIAFNNFKRIRPNDNSDKRMGFYVRQKPAQDELRLLLVDVADGSYASGYGYLDDYGRFVRICPR